MAITSNENKTQDRYYVTVNYIFNPGYVPERILTTECSFPIGPKGVIVTCTELKREIIWLFSQKNNGSVIGENFEITFGDGYKKFDMTLDLKYTRITKFNVLLGDLYVDVDFLDDKFLICFPSAPDIIPYKEFMQRVYSEYEARRPLTIAPISDCELRDSCGAVISSDTVSLSLSTMVKRGVVHIQRKNVTAINIYLKLRVENTDEVFLDHFKVNFPLIPDIISAVEFKQCIFKEILQLHPEVEGKIEINEFTFEGCMKLDNKIALRMLSLNGVVLVQGRMFTAKMVEGISQTPGITSESTVALARSSAPYKFFNRHTTPPHEHDRAYAGSSELEEVSAILKNPESKYLFMSFLSAHLDVEFGDPQLVTKLKGLNPEKLKLCLEEYKNLQAIPVSQPR